MSDTTEATPQKQTPDEIAADIEATRSRLADSVDALSDKLDVKAQAKEKVHEATDDVRAKVVDAAESAQQGIGAATHQAVETSRTLVERFKAASLPVQAALVGVPLALVVTLIVRQARS